MKILKTKSYYFGVTQNADGTLNITAEYQHIGNGKWVSCKSAPWENADALIGSMGGIDKVLERCEEIEDLAAIVESRNEANKKNHERQAAADSAIKEDRRLRHEAVYKVIFTDGKRIESTLENIAVLLKYLNDQNWGGWSLPAMTVGYSCHQYDCDGKIATTIKLDEPVEGYTMLQYGAPRGYLTAYTNIDRAILDRTEE